MFSISNNIFWLLLFFASHFCAAQEIYFNVPSGFYSSDFELEISSNFNGDIRYTLDGSDPTEESPIYISPIQVTENTSPNSISNIPTNPLTTFFKYVWKAPLVTIPKTRIVKAALFNNQIQLSNIFYQEYFIGETLGEIELPIFSIVGDSLDWFGYETGIYIPGKDYDDDPDIWQPGNYYNKGDDWEKTMSLNFYNNQNWVFQQNTSVEMHGGGSRIMPCKSLRLNAKTSLGKSHFEYPFFEDRNWEKYKRLLLRNSGQDFNRSLFADVLLQSLLKGQNIESQASQQVVVFINGSYWGIHNLREKYDKYYFENYHNNDLEDIDYIEIAMAYISKEGSADDYELMIESLLLLDLSKEEDYKNVSQQIDIESFIDNHISKVYGGGNDWSGNNERLWRSHEVGSKWRWLANDYDDIFENLGKDSYLHATRVDWEGWPNPEWSTRLFRSLMENNGFANQYKNRLKFHLENTYSADNVIAKIDSISNIYRPEMQRQIDRWNYPNSLDDWESIISDFKDYANQRPDFVWQNFLDYFPNIYENPEELLIYPNPVQEDFFQVGIPENWDVSVLLQIFHSDGKLMQEWKMTNDKLNIIDMDNLENGIYILVVSDEVNREVRKLVIAK